MVLTSLCRILGCCHALFVCFFRISRCVEAKYYIHLPYIETNVRLENMNEYFMRRAIALSEQSVKDGGGPFGAVIVKDGEIVAEASNSVTTDTDPTAHAEVNAIRKAAKRLGSFNLEGCEIYTSCEPCPMCLGAIYWAHLSKIYYCNTREDAAKIGFDDDFIYREFSVPLSARKIAIERVLAGEGDYVFKQWGESEEVKRY